MKFLQKKKKFTKMYKFWKKNWSLVPKNVHFVPKNGKICTFYTKNEVFAKKFHCSRVSVKISKQLTKINDFLLFLCFHENRRILHCFHRRYEFCMQKYPSKCIFIEFP